MNSNCLAVLVRGLSVAVVCGAVLQAAAQDACSLLSTQQVMAVMGVPMNAGPALGGKICQWGEQGVPGPGGMKQVRLTMMSAEEYASRVGPPPVPSPKATQTPISGIGDQASFATRGTQVATLAVKKGHVYFVVQATGLPIPQLQAKEVALARDVVAKL